MEGADPWIFFPPGNLYKVGKTVSLWNVGFFLQPEMMDFMGLHRWLHGIYQGFWLRFTPFLWYILKPSKSPSYLPQAVAISLAPHWDHLGSGSHFFRTATVNTLWLREFLLGKYYVVTFFIANKQIERKVELTPPTCSIGMYFRKIIQNNSPLEKSLWHVFGGTPILDGQDLGDFSATLRKREEKKQRKLQRRKIAAAWLPRM